MKTATIFTTLTCCLLAAMCSCNALFCNTCVLEQCPEANDCPAGKVMDSCGCCEVCAIPLGGACHTVEDLGLCADGKFCLPDGGLFSGAISGKCLDITECFSSGCDVIDDSCDCAYSNSCPTKNFAFGDLLSCEISILENSTETEEASGCVNFGCEIVDNQCQCNYSESCPMQSFSYSTREECEVALKVASCNNLVCESLVVCPVGSYYEPGPLLPGNCCPSAGVCWCDEELCPGEPDCSEGFEASLLTSANDTEGQCCDTYECTRVTCEHNGRRLQHNQALFVDACTSCECYNGEVFCHVLSCSPPLCAANEELVLTPGYCCPSCQPRAVIDPPNVPTCEIEGEYTDPENPCRICSCYEGRTACFEEGCAPLACEKPVILPGTCCPVCEGDLDPAQPMTAVPATTAETTTALNEPIGITDTVTRREPEVATDFFIAIDPPYVPQCEIEGVFTDPEHPCRICSCYEGRTACYQETCSPLACEKPVLLPGTCCPVCEEDLGTTAAKTPTEDPTEAQTTEMDTTAPEEATHQPIFPPVIPLCEIEGVFTDPENPCRVCSCYEGRTACFEEGCAPLDCENPVHLPGTCCPVCEEQPTTVSTTEEQFTEESTTVPIDQDATTDVATEEPTTEAINNGVTTSAPLTTEAETTTRITTPEVTTPTVPTSPEITLNYSPYVPQSCSRQQQSNSSPRDSCLTCMCVRGSERCVDESRSLCEVPHCKNPVLVEGQCCPVCIQDDTTTTVPVADSSVILIAMVANVGVISRQEGVVVEIIEEEMKVLGYTLLDMQAVTINKALVELILVVEISAGSDDKTDDLIQVAVLERLSMNSPTSSSTQDVHTDFETPLTDNVVLIVCVVSFLVALILLTVFSIFIICVWITRLNKKRSRKVPTTERV